MITIDDAIKIAKERNERVDTVQEYADAYMFYVDDGEIHEGGENNGFIVTKRDGSVLRWARYFMDAARDVVEIGEPKRI